MRWHETKRYLGGALRSGGFDRIFFHPERDRGEEKVSLFQGFNAPASAEDPARLSSGRP